MVGKVLKNPKIKDVVTVLKTVDETNHEYTLLEIEVEEGGGNSWHYHTSFDEQFIPIEGELGIGLKKKEFLLRPGETAIAKAGEMHRFFNPGKGSIRFQVMIMSQDSRFLQSLAIGYGLAADGLTTDKGIPKKLDHLALMLALSDTRLPGVVGLITPLLLRRGQRLLNSPMAKEMLDKYYGKIPQNTPSFS